MSRPQIETRPATDDDVAFLVRVFADSRSEELALVPLSQDQKAAFVQQQFEAQQRDYWSRFPNSIRSIVLIDGVAQGVIWVDERKDEIRLLDIALLGEARNRGVGTRLLNDLQRKASSAGKPLRHTVFAGNAAATRFYRRLGFAVIENAGMYSLMEWRGTEAG